MLRVGSRRLGTRAHAPMLVERERPGQSPATWAGVVWQDGPAHVRSSWSRLAIDCTTLMMAELLLLYAWFVSCHGSFFISPFVPLTLSCRTVPGPQFST